VNPILASAAFGYFKALAAKRLGMPASKPNFTREILSAPLEEEFRYRVLPFLSAGDVPIGSTAVPFALAHRVKGLPRSFNSFRVLDATTGGLLYEAAYRQYGFFGAFLAHALHNLGVTLGEKR